MAYCFTLKVNMITDHKPLVAILERTWGGPFTQASKYPTVYTSIQHEGPVQTRTPTVYSKLAVQAQPE